MVQAQFLLFDIEKVHYITKGHFLADDYMYQSSLIENE